MSEHELNVIITSGSCLMYHARTGLPPNVAKDPLNIRLEVELPARRKKVDNSAPIPSRVQAICTSLYREVIPSSSICSCAACIGSHEQLECGACRTEPMPRFSGHSMHVARFRVHPYPRSRSMTEMTYLGRYVRNAPITFRLQDWKVVLLAISGTEDAMSAQHSAAASSFCISVSISIPCC